MKKTLITFLLIILATITYAGLLPSVFAKKNIITLSGVTSNNLLIARWNFDTDNGLYQPDITGRGNNMYIGTPTYPPFILNGAGYFNGNAGLKTITTGMLDGYKAHTISFWVKPISFYDDSMFIGTRSASASIRAENQTIDNIGFAISGNRITGVTNSLPTNVWTHITMQYRDDGSPTMAIYTNGQYAQSVTNASINPVTVGASWSMGYDSYYPARYIYGALDDVRLYTNVISASALYAEGRSITDPLTNVYTALPSGAQRMWLTPNYTGRGVLVDRVSDVGIIYGTSGSQFWAEEANSFYYPGAGDVIISVPGLVSTNAGEWTISWWMLPTGYGYTQLMNFYAAYSASDYLAIDMSYYIATHRKISLLNVGKSQLQAETPIGFVPTNRFINITIVQTLTNQTIYGDGVTNTIANYYTPLNTNSFYISPDGVSFGSKYYGYMDNVILWGRALTPTEVGNVYSLLLTNHAVAFDPRKVAGWTFSSTNYNLTINDVTICNHSLTNKSVPDVYMKDKAIRLNGAYAYIGTAETNLFDNAKEITVSFWINFHTTYIPGGWGSALGANNMGLMTVGSQWRMYSGASTDNAGININSTTGIWQHIVGTFKENGNGNIDDLKIYTNGILANANTCNVTNFHANNQAWQSSWIAGAGQKTDMDDISMYTNALTDAEILSLYQRGRQ